MNRYWVHLLCVCWLMTGCARADADYPTPYGERADVAEYLDELAAQHAFDRESLNALFSEARQRQDIIDRISRPAEKTWTWARYRSHLVDAKRISKGVEFWDANAATLERAEAQYGVAPEVVLAVLGIETRYGEITGGYRVLDALTTLGFDYPPRAAFFRKELTEFLLLAREEGKDPRALTGSYAGAMGYGQFIPSSYRHYAVDFDADGVRDIWQNPEDAIGSIANYFARHKWRGDGPVAVPVELSSPPPSVQPNASLELRHTVKDLQALGVQVAGVAPDAKAALFKLEADQGTEYWLGLHDFYVITRYNRSHLYAFAVYELSESIKARRQLDLVMR